MRAWGAGTLVKPEDGTVPPGEEAPTQPAKPSSLLVDALNGHAGGELFAFVCYTAHKGQTIPGQCGTHSALC